MVCNGRNSRRYLSRAHHLLLKWHSHVRRVGLQVRHLQPVAPVWHAYGRCMQLAGKTNSSCNPVQMACFHLRLDPLARPAPLEGA